MSKKLCAALLISFSIFSSSLSAWSCTSLEFRYAALCPQEHLFREIYGNVVSNWQLEANVRIRGPFYLWASTDYLSKDGRSVGLKDRTRVNIANFSIGGKYIFDWCTCGFNLSPYVGAGVVFGGVWVRNHSHFVHKRASKGLFGVVTKAGIYYQITPRIFVDVFVDYLYERAYFHHGHDENLGGVKPGVGIGYNY